MFGISRLFLLITAFTICTIAHLRGQGETKEGVFNTLDGEEIDLSQVPSTGRIFDSEEILKATIEANFEKLLTYRDDPDYQKAYFHIQINDSIKIVKKMRVSVRGKTRVSICDMPPLKIDIKKNDFKWEGLKGLNVLKVVTSCKDTKTYNQYVIKEYITYKGYGLLTDMSYRVRLMELTLVDNQGAMEPVTQYGFLIESDKRLAKRLKCKEVTSKKITTAELAQQFYYNPNKETLFQLNVLSLYQYMIGNTDWGASQFHNVKIFLKDSLYFPVPYDFDYAGIIATDYAVPSPSLPIQSVEERHYLGPCGDLEDFQIAIDYIISKKDELSAIWNDNPYLRKKERTEVNNYVNSFFSKIQDPKAQQAILKTNCQN